MPFSGMAGVYQRHRYAKEVREAFELWSRHIEALTDEKAAAAQAMLIARHMPSEKIGMLRPEERHPEQGNVVHSF